jgi:hypothetical protein
MSGSNLKPGFAEMPSSNLVFLYNFIILHIYPDGGTNQCLTVAVIPKHTYVKAGHCGSGNE